MKTRWITWVALGMMIAACDSSDDDGGTSGRDGGTSGLSDGGGDDAGCTSNCTTGDGGTGPGPGGTGGTGTFARPGFYDQFLVVDADGVVHLLFTDGAAQYVNYGRCIEHCGDPESWNVVRLLSNTEVSATTISAAGLGVDATGRLHALIDAVPLFGGPTTPTGFYVTCTTGCSVPENWSGLNLTATTGGRNTIGAERTFMVEASGRVSFLALGANGSDEAWYASCGSNCTVAASWSVAAAFIGDPVYAQRDAAGVTHAIVGGYVSPGGDRLFKYARCASSCGTSANWSMSTLGWRHSSGDYTAGFTVTDAGRVFLGYAQGVLNPVDAADNLLVVRSCLGATCLDLNTWQSLTVGDSREGEEGVEIVSSGDSVLLASTTVSELRVYLCADGNCEQPASWDDAIVADDSASIAQAIPPASGTSCPSTATFAAWYPSRPVLAVAPQGVLGIHKPYALVTCPGQTSASRLPPIGRVISEF